MILYLKTGNSKQYSGTLPDKKATTNSKVEGYLEKKIATSSIVTVYLEKKKKATANSIVVVYLKNDAKRQYTIQTI